MRIYKNDLTDKLITEKEYDNLNSFDKEDYSYYRSVTKGNSQDDLLLSGVIGYATNSAILGTLLGGSLLGGMLGDIFNGRDLMD